MWTGGIVGVNDSGVVENSFSTGTVIVNGVSGNNYVGSTGTETTSGNSYEDTDPASWDTSIWDFSGATPSFKNDSSQNGGKSISLQIGYSDDDTSQLEISDLGVNLSTLNINLSSKSSARSSIGTLDEMINTITNQQAIVGSHVNHLTSLINTNEIRSQELTQSNSSIIDTDIAEESANLLKNQIKTQSAISLLQQAKNLNAQNILNLY